MSSEPLKSHKFTVDIDGVKVGVMNVAGLALGPTAAERIGYLTRAVVPGSRELSDWAQAGNTRKLVVDVGESVIISVDARAGILSFSELHAGEMASKLFTETLYFSYSRSERFDH